MLQKLSRIDKLAHTQKLESKGVRHFNAQLPIVLKVLAKAQNNTYALKLGNTTIHAQTHTPLQIGKSYWANMQNNAAGQILISKLVPKPDIDSTMKAMPLKLTLADLSHLSSDPKGFMHELKDFLLHHLATATHKDDFKELSLLALSLAQGVLSLVVQEDGRDHLVQISQKHSPDVLSFYAIFPRLGPISGQVYQAPESPNSTPTNPIHKSPNHKNEQKLICANLSVMNDRVKELLESHSDELGFHKVYISSDSVPKELFSLAKASLLDVRT